jgi:hypothetical protein
MVTLCPLLMVMVSSLLVGAGGDAIHAEPLYLSQVDETLQKPEVHCGSHRQFEQSC